MKEQILNLMIQNKSLKEISNELKISEKQLWVKIKQMIYNGYNIVPKYSHTSDIFFDIIKEPFNSKIDETNIFIPCDKKDFRFLVVSDLHQGKNSNIKLMNQVYEYASKNDINSIFICGDQIDSDYSKKLNLSKVESQVDDFIKYYPYDKNITNYMLIGNHDFRSLHLSGFDISKRINNLRYDIVPVGYGIGNIKLKEDYITLVHKLECIDIPEEDEKGKIILLGHAHMMKTKVFDRILIYVPSLSYNCPDATKVNVPGFIDMNIVFEKKKIECFSYKHMMVEPNVFEASENKIKLKSLK